ncbi:MAG: class I SAM-dependent methyltransferase [Nitrospirota bacterium]|nr:class I SAM-dependent methyltransferase [Nitrospirota bacterium]MDP3595565.1 class I SAM-dependent methyltransferase [Nitrospirota bacterium]
MLKEYVAASSASAQTADEFVASFWDQRWRDLKDGRRLQRLRLREEYRFLKKVIPNFGDRPLDILDCGCGLGEWTLLFHLDGHRAVGIDIAGETIRQLHAKHGDAFRFGDFRKVECLDKSYDVAINWGGIEHFEEGPTPAILEAKRVLRPGGLFVATTPCHNFRLFLLDALFSRGIGPAYPIEGHRFYQYRFSRTELESYFRACGFTHVRSHIIGGAQGVQRCLQHELGWLGKHLPRMVRVGLEQVGGLLLRPFLGHMVICSGRVPEVNRARIGE